MGWTMTLPINVKGKMILAVVDTAAQGTIINQKLIQKIKISVQPNTNLVYEVWDTF